MAVPSLTVRPGTLPTAAAVIAPEQLRIDAIGVSASVMPAGVNAGTGEFAVPPSVDQVGWYRFGPGLDAAAGSVVIAGHVDWAEQGQGAFFRLRELSPGDHVDVTGTDGVLRRFVVAEREVWQKELIPLAEYFDRTGPLRLTLITCGGPFDEPTRRYRDNVVVTATPL
jgi:hypothetical protein